MTFSSYYAASSTSGIFTAGRSIHIHKRYPNWLWSEVNVNNVAIIVPNESIFHYIVGFGDGSVKLFDIRTPHAGVATFSDLDCPILDCRLQVNKYYLSNTASF